MRKSVRIIQQLAKINFFIRYHVFRVNSSLPVLKIIINTGGPLKRKILLTLLTHHLVTYI